MNSDEADGTRKGADGPVDRGEESTLLLYHRAYVGVVAALASELLATSSENEIRDRLAVDLPFQLSPDALEDLRAELNWQREWQRLAAERQPVDEIRRAA